MKQKLPDISMFTDASLQVKDGSAGWSMWARTDEERVLVSGRMKDPCYSAEIAEMMAVCNGVFVLSKLGWLQEGTVLLIKTDCLAVVHRLTEKAKIPAAQEELYDSFFQMKADLGFHFWAKHVRGHQRSTEKKHYVNNLCDELCKEARVKGEPGKLYVGPELKRMHR